ncbi:MAG: hypothetical protein ACI4RQ_00395 [Methanobrevibacter wolinii]|uniref:hypothetical protein n=1 Tax=Methanobrevibacter wolinii TaxID=190977 RepID=UPI0005B26DCE|nr:hypothetical protein [Methanobrevibacter wolinii]MDD5959194.1 hypothetical protein [Methanobrevibacter wolinii]
MSYKIKNAIIKRNNNGINEFNLFDSNNEFKDKDVLVAIDSDDLITIQLIINAIINNDFKKWNEIEVDESESLKTLFVKLGYTREELLELLKEI